MKINVIQNQLLNSPMRMTIGSVELTKGSTTTIYTEADNLKSIEVSRTGEKKFFGYGVSQKLTTHLVDKNREINVAEGDQLKPYLGVKDNQEVEYTTNNFPTFDITEVKRDENTNELTITAFDKLAVAAKHTVNELSFPASIEENQISGYDINTFALACSTLLGLNGIKYVNTASSESCWTTYYEDGANFDGSESVREALNDLAEATQTIYYIDEENYLVFKRLIPNSIAIHSIDKSKYYTLESKTNRTLTTIVSATELGDNVSATTGEEGATQYVRDNAFWALREDIDTLLENAVAAVGGLTINQFSIDWRGNYLLEIGDCISFVTKDNQIVNTFLLDDVISYNGALSEKTTWEYKDDEATAANPSTLGEKLKQTFAQVDKANQRIDLVVSESEAMAQSISSLQLNSQGVNASVESMKKTIEDGLGAVNTDIATLNQKVEASITSEQVDLKIQTELEKGSTKVVTHTGFTFDDEGLTVSKSGSEMTTQITEDGMTVYKNSEAMLTANNEGVDAVNLKASTFLIIGHNSRFEDYGYDRTGCFWIGN